MAQSLVLGNPLALLGRMAIADSRQLSALWACGEATMNEAELKEIRDSLIPLDADARRMLAALLAHIDAQAAEITDREGKYVDLLRTKHALAAEVKRLTQVSNYYFATMDKYHKLVQEADGIIGDAYGSHYDARLSAADRCPWCKRAAAWREKAQA